MREYLENIDLGPRWWWGSVAAVVVVALIFLAIGSVAAALSCLVFAAIIAALAWIALSGER